MSDADPAPPWGPTDGSAAARSVENTPSPPSGDSDAMTPLVPDDPVAIGPYRLVGRLGAGGMGTVYGAVDASGTRVAVKVIHSRFARDPDFRARFAREVDLLRRVHGICTVEVLAADTEADVPWLASSYVAGPTLRQHVHAHGPLTGDLLLGTAAGVAEALTAIHSAGIVHRDLKPGNVILSPDGPRILDFGIARAVDETAITRTGGVIGTPGWIPPEQYAGTRPTPAADMFALGGLVAFAATGRNPFGTGTPDILGHRTRHSAPDVEGVPTELAGLARSCLSKDPAARPPAEDALHAVLTRWARDTAFPGDPGLALTRMLTTSWRPPAVVEPEWTLPPRPTKRGRSLLVGAVAGGLVCVLALGVALAVPPIRDAVLAPFLPPDDAASGESSAEAGTDAGPDTGDTEPAEADDRLAAQNEIATWRPFDPDAAPDQEYAALLEDSDDVIPETAVLDHDTEEFTMSSDSVPRFPVVTVQFQEISSTGEGVEVTAEFTYHPHVGGLPVYAEDLTLGGAEGTYIGGSGDFVETVAGTREFIGPTRPVEISVLSPEEPVQTLTVEVPGAPSVGWIYYRPAEFTRYHTYTHDVVGHCYDVDGTTDWRDDTHLGNEQFAMADYRPEQSLLTNCPSADQ